ncbi:hypothetical protein C8R45DRAFT_1081457 [Mycena sanguinolenta]|nr:hypothetical protein C8R45DRAFT_1081457 [Mycena sanguinolenta]
MDNAKSPVELRDNPGHSDSQALISEAPFEILAKIFLEFRDIALAEGPVWGTLAAITSLDNTPRLHSISIQTSGFQPLDARMLPLAWTNLISIDLEHVGLSVDGTAYLLPQCTQARLLRFTTKTEASWESMPPIARVCIPELTELKWWGLDVDDFSIFDRLILPRWAPSSFASLYSHSNFSLTKLTLVLIRFMDAERFFAFLRAMPNLTSLYLHLCIPITSKFLSFLTYDPDKNPVLPSLEYIMLADWEQKFSESDMLRMVESRWGPTPFARGQIRTNLMLPNVRVTNTLFFRKAARSPPSELHLSVRKRIAELVEEGLKFEYENKILQA